MGERCALAASSGLINAAPDEASKRFLATQTLDEARHVERMQKEMSYYMLATFADAFPNNRVGEIDAGKLRGVPSK